MAEELLRLGLTSLTTGRSGLSLRSSLRELFEANNSYLVKREAYLEDGRQRTEDPSEIAVASHRVKWNRE